MNKTIAMPYDYRLRLINGNEVPVFEVHALSRKGLDKYIALGKAVFRILIERRELYSSFWETIETIRRVNDSLVSEYPA
jgi:hypothetical protein